MVQYIAGGRPTSVVVPPQRLSPSRASAPGLLGNNHKKPLQTLPGRSLGPPTAMARRLSPVGYGEREYVVSFIRHSEWPSAEIREQEDLLETMQDQKIRHDVRLHQASCQRQGARPHSGPRSASDRHGDRSHSPTPRVFPPTVAHVSSAGALQSPRSNKKEAISRKDAMDDRGQCDQIAAMFQKSFSDKAANPHVALTSSRPPSHSPGRTRKPSNARAGSASTSAPRVRSGSPCSTRRASPVKAPSSPRVSSPRSPVSPRTKSNSIKSKSPQSRTRKASDPTLCPPRPISGTRSPGPPESSAPASTRSSWPRRSSAPSSPPCSARSSGCTALIAPLVKGSSPRLARHTLQPTRSTQAYSPSDRIPSGKLERAEAVCSEKGRSDAEPSAPDEAILPSPYTQQPDETRAEAFVETPDCIYADVPHEWPTTVVASSELQRPALREIQPQAVAARSHPKEKENQGHLAKPLWQANPPNARHLASDTAILQRVLVRTEECRKLETMEEKEPASTPCKEKVHSMVRTPCGRGLPQRLVPLSSSTTHSPWSLCNSEDSPSTWSAGIGSGSGMVTDLEEGDQVGFPLSRPRLSHGSCKAGDYGACRESPPSPSTPFFGKASANDVDSALAPPQEPCRSVVTDTCARVLYELRRNRSLIRLTCEEEMARLNASTRERRQYEV